SRYSRTARSRSSVGYFFGAAMDDLHRAYRHVIRDLQENGGNSGGFTLDPPGIGVVLRAERLCMTLSGVQAPGATTTTTALLGLLGDDHHLRGEFPHG
ncbi:MAG: GTP cyclohydrolase I, partial [Dactylosporangium sp.]|nr:GTP cyclohydrolase I [Dactylosporangium sp.]